MGRVVGLYGSDDDDDVVYFETQGRDRMCGLHCINNVLQVTGIYTPHNLVLS